MTSDDLGTIVSRAACTALLRIGNTLQERGLLHHALSTYLKIVAYYPGSEEAPAAADKLVEIARAFETNRQYHIAMSVYDRLERAARFRRWNGHQATPEGRIL